ncbi:MAG: hypothetical protein J5680_05490 [Neisseriaceae bacterium]|nr:hypothetical protein [Neisseriaceae bacterium]
MGLSNKFVGWDNPTHHNAVRSCFKLISGYLKSFRTAWATSCPPYKLNPI